MNRRAVLALFALVPSVGGCAPIALTSQGRSVQLMKADPPTGCKEVGSVSGETTEASEGAKNDMRNKAAAIGANYVRIETHHTGTAYACPNAAGSEGAPPLP
jgi:hypothetical protein